MEEKILAENNKHKKNRLSKELEIVKAQHAKGVESMQNLDI